MSLNTKSVYQVMLVLLYATISACGGGGSAGSPNNNGSAGLTGTIIFDQGHTVYYDEHYGIMEYDIKTNTMNKFVEGKYPHRRVNGNITVLLQFCYEIVSQGQYYRVVIADQQGLITPISECSDHITNPTTNDFSPQNTEFSEVSLSADESLIATVASYFTLNGNVYWIIIYDLAGNIVATIDHAYNPEWTPDGRLLYAYGNHFYLTDQNLSSSTMIDDGGKLNAAVNWPSMHPSGNYFVFTHNAHIWQMNLDGSGLQKLLESSENLHWPTWSPDGTTIVFTIWKADNSYPYEAFFFYNVENGEQQRIDIGNFLSTSGEPWGKISWVE